VPARRDEGSVRELTLTEAAVLALLEIEGEKTGYDLLKLAEKAIAHVWAPAKSQLYATLRRLAGSGLAVSKRVEQAGRPDKQLFRITATGSERLHDWLAVVDGRETEATLLKLFVGGLMPVELYTEHVEPYRAAALERLSVYEEIEPTNTRRAYDYFHYLMLEHGIAHARTTVRWADGVLRELRESGDAERAVTAAARIRGALAPH
jgi:DNA-binding PadR family transcriptional regulator